MVKRKNKWFYRISEEKVQKFFLKLIFSKIYSENYKTFKIGPLEIWTLKSNENQFSSHKMWSKAKINSSIEFLGKNTTGYQFEDNLKHYLNPLEKLKVLRKSQF